MKRIVLFSVLALCLAAPSVMTAQNSSDWNHAEIGVFADYFRLSRTTPDINFVGLGARGAFNIHPNVQLELVNTRLRPLTALFGPKFQAGTSGPFRAFVAGKVGFVNFSTSDQNALSGFKGALGGVTDGNTRFAVYPGAGIEGFWGPFGLRLDVGDVIYFDSGAQNNLRVTFGPQIRF